MIKNILTRVASGSVYVALIVLSLLLLDHSPITYWIVFSAIIVLGIKEINDMTDTGEPASWLIMLLDMLGGVAVFFAFYLIIVFLDFQLDRSVSIRQPEHVARRNVYLFRYLQCAMLPCQLAYSMS